MSTQEPIVASQDTNIEKKKLGRTPFAFSSVVVVAAFVIGIQFAYLTLRAINIQHAVKDWPVAEATIESGAIVSSKGTSGSAVRWSPEWSYTYTANGSVYHSKSTSVKYGYAAPWHPTKESAQEDLAKRPVGFKVSVHYNPDEPTLSVIDIREPGFLEMLPAFVSLLGFTVGGFLFVWLRREFRKIPE